MNSTDVVAPDLPLANELVSEGSIARSAGLEVSTSTGRHHIRHLTPLCRVLVHGFITLPKLGINFLLFVTTC